MPAKFHLIAPGVWNRAFRESSKEAKIVAFYVWSCRNRVSEGLFELSVPTVAAETGLSVEEVETAFKELEAIGVIEYDTASEVVLDRLALRANPLRNGRNKETGEVIPDGRISKAVKLFEQVPDSELKIKFVALADCFSPDFADAIRAESRYAYPPPVEAPQGGPPTGAQGGASREESSSYEEEKSRGESSSQARHSTRAREDGWEEDNWLFGQLPMEACVACGHPTHVRDPDGRPRHTMCDLNAQNGRPLKVVNVGADEEGGF